MVLKSMGKIGTRRGRSIVVRDDIDKTVSGRRVRQGIGKLMKLQAKDYHDPDGAAKRRWRLQHVREHVRVFVEEERDEKVKEGAMSTLDILLVAAGGLSVALAGGAAWRATEGPVLSIVFGLVAALATWILGLVALGFGLVEITGNAGWKKTGRVRADCWLAATPDMAFAFVSAPDAGVRREASSWFEHHVARCVEINQCVGCARNRHAIEQEPRRWRGGRRADRNILIPTQVVRSFDAHTSLVDVVEVAPAGWPRLMASRPRVSRTLRFWSKDGDGTFTIVATCAQGTKEDEENGGMPQRFYGVATNTEEDLTVIRPSADGDGAVITRVVDVEARLILGLVGRASRCATAWQGRRLCDDLVALRAACAHVVDDSAWHKDERRSHFNFGRDELKRSTQYFTQERLDRQQTDSSSEGGPDKPELASRMPDPGPATLSMRMPGMAQCKDSKRFCDAFKCGTPGYLPRHDPDQTENPRWGTYGEPLAEAFMVRGANYLKDRKKRPSGPALCKLAGVDMLKDAKKPPLKLGERPNGICSRLVSSEGLVFVVNMVLPTPSYYVSAVIYWIVPNKETLTDPTDIALRARVQEFCDSLTDAQRDDVMKIVPRMVEGPWVAKHAVGQKPALLGHAITTAYHSGPGWFEMDVDVSSSSTAAGALRILKSCSKSLVMDLAFVLEGQTPEALPEKILGTVEWNHFDLDPDNSPVIKVCADDN